MDAHFVGIISRLVHAVGLVVLSLVPADVRVERRLGRELALALLPPAAVRVSPAVRAGAAAAAAAAHKIGGEGKGTAHGHE